MSATPASPAPVVWRHAPALAAVVASIVALAYSAAPSLTLVNDGMEVRGRPGAWLVALVAAALWLVLALMRRTPRETRLGLALALGASALGLDRGLFLLRLDGVGISRRGLFGTAALAWTEVTRVDTGSARLIAWAGDERQVSVALDRWTPEQRATLERAIARRVREATAPAAPR